MNRAFPARVASVCVGPDDLSDDVTRMAAALLAASPRVAIAAPGLWRTDARGWERRGGEMALAHALQIAAGRGRLPGETAAEVGGASTGTGVGVGVADVPVASDAAAAIALRRPDRVLIVPSADTRSFLAALPLSVLPLSESLHETFRALGLRKVHDLVRRSRGELEARFGPEGVRAHRLACGEDDRAFHALRSEGLPEAALALEPPAEGLEPLLFVLRHLLARVCADLSGIGRAAARIEIGMTLEGGGRSTATVAPARPTRREGLLHDLCRAALERALEDNGRLTSPVEEFSIRVLSIAAPDTRQGDLFVTEWRDPMAAAAALSRLRGRLGKNGVVWPAPRADRRPETRNSWRPVEMEIAAHGSRRNSVMERAAETAVSGTLPGVLRLLPEPLPVQVKTVAGRPLEVIDTGRTREIVVAEGPERLSGDWWKDPYRREYFRVCTVDGELLWLYREIRHSGELRWWLHGWWD
jgi:protein ImuB